MADVINGLENLQPYFDGIAADFTRINFQAFGRLELYELEDLHAKYFADASDPTGAAWPQLAQSTIDRKGHGTILVDTGRLLASLTGGGADGIRDVAEVSDMTNIIFGTNVEYSGLHDEATWNRPARRHVGINEQFLDGFVDRLLQYTINELAAI